MGFVQDMEGVRLRYSAASLPAASLLWCGPAAGHWVLTVAVPLVATPCQKHFMFSWELQHRHQSPSTEHFIKDWLSPALC